ncbi:hypothetical protein V8E54_013194 [Elaphomyces granulatus]
MNSPYQAKDLLPYEPERQQLRMDAVKNFRPYKPERQMLHILTKHLQRHNLRMPIRHRHMIRKLYHRCKTPMRIRTPKSANHNVSSMNFAESRNWPPCRSKSNVKIQRERDLLAQLRRRLTESARPESSRPESD